jgi:predicted metal-binding protein
MTAPPVTLHLCTACRKPGHKANTGQTFDSVGHLAIAAGEAARDAGVDLTVVRTPCLSGCATGLTAMIDIPAGMVRLQGMKTAEQAALAIANAERLVDGEPVEGLTVLSRVKWSEWDAS